MSRVPVVINGLLVEAEPGWTVLEAARSAGVEIPTLCHHEQTGTRGLCRLCLVEIAGRARPEPACATTVAPGMVVNTESDDLRRLRRTVLELVALETNVEQDAGLTGWLAAYEAEPERWGEPLAGRREREPLRDNPFFVREYDRCYNCRRCLDACGEGIQGVWALAFAGRGAEAGVTTAFDLPLAEAGCVFCGNCLQVCPTGALVPVEELSLAEGGLS
ncbi:2Fe-2S iron-sulfur cluster-binding protein [Oceanithermus sp.]